MARPRKTPIETQESPEPAKQTTEPNPTSELAKALVEAIRSTQPAAKKTAFNKPHGGPWAPKDGSPKLRLKRKSFHHGLLLGDPSEPNNRLTNEEIALFNKLKPGKYCNNIVTVTRRRDKGIDIDYPVRTAAQRLRLLNDFGIRNFKELLEHCVNEAAQPKRVESDEDE